MSNEGGLCIPYEHENYEREPRITPYCEYFGRYLNFSCNFVYHLNLTHASARSKILGVIKKLKNPENRKTRSNIRFFPIDEYIKFLALGDVEKYFKGG